MVLTEYDEKGYIAYEKRLSHAEGWTKGVANGEFRKLVQLVCKKLSKGKAPTQIAEDLEEDILTVAEICDAAVPFAPDYDCDKIVIAIKGDESQEQDDDFLF